MRLSKDAAFLLRLGLTLFLPLLFILTRLAFFPLEEAPKIVYAIEFSSSVAPAAEDHWASSLVSPQDSTCPSFSSLSLASLSLALPSWAKPNFFAFPSLGLPTSDTSLGEAHLFLAHLFLAQFSSSQSFASPTFGQLTNCWPISEVNARKPRNTKATRGQGPSEARSGEKIVNFCESSSKNLLFFRSEPLTSRSRSVKCGAGVKCALSTCFPSEPFFTEKDFCHE